MIASDGLIPLVAPTITKHDRGYLYDRIDAGLLENESEVRRFEEAFAERVGCEWAVAVNSGTSALIVALRALAISDVMIPSYSCVALRNAAEAGTISYMDSWFDVPEQRLTIGYPTGGAFSVVSHAFGRELIMTWRPTIEDYTLSLGGVAQFSAQRLGVCSTHASKMLSTGRGGVIFGDDPELLADVCTLVHYEDHKGFGYSVGMSAMQAALGVSQLDQLDLFIERRRELAHRYTDAFRPAGIECPDADCGSVFFRYLISVTDPAAKLAKLAERGIEAGRGVYPPLHQLAGLSDDQFPGTMAAVNSLLSVPVHPSITDEQAAYIVEQVIQVCAP